MKTITILGSTGSVGRQVLDVISKYPGGYKVVGLSAYSNDALLREQLEEFKPEYYYFPNAAVDEQEEQAAEFDCSTVNGITNKNIAKRLSSLVELAQAPADIVVSAVSGIAGLWPAVAVLKRGGTLAIANKETIVCAGRHLKELERQFGGRILPLDTEHSAIFSCLKGEDKKQVKSLVLTASGGALRDYPINELSKVTAEEALRHPVWKMGKKVTIDCATLFNKGLEIIEAMRLFEIDNVSVLMHRQSIVHALVEYDDNSLKGLFSTPDMRLAIDTALSYPKHGKKIIQPLNLAQVGSLTFSEPDYYRYPCLRIAIDAAKAGEGACIALSAADEVLVDEFLKGNIKYTDIPTVLSKVLNEFENVGDVNLEDVLGIDEKARKYTYSMLGLREYLV